MSVELIEYNGIKYAEIIWPNMEVEEMTFFWPSESSFQVGMLTHKVGFVEPDHYHKPITRTIIDLPHISVVQREVLAVQLYSDNGELSREIFMRPSDAIILINSMHAIRVIEDMQCIRVKIKPFLGTEHAKVFVEVKL